MPALRGGHTATTQPLSLGGKICLRHSDGVWRTAARAAATGGVWLGGRRRALQQPAIGNAQWRATMPCAGTGVERNLHHLTFFHNKHATA